MQGPSDQELLSGIPDFLSISQMFKATPAQEGGERFVYLEASNEALDQQNEVVLAKALSDSSDYFLKFGNLDLDHYSQIGARLGIPNPELYEIGRPIDVRVKNGQTFVKGQIYKGAGPVAEKANQFWSSLTEISPPMRWYPSVAGKVLDRGVDLDAKTGLRKAVIKAVRWGNIGFSKSPVNSQLPTVSTVPFGALCKSFGPGGFDFAKALEAGYGTDSASLSGGAALRAQSLQGSPHSYFDFRERMSKSMLDGKCGKNPGARELVAHATKEFGLPEDEAAEHVERFMRDIQSGLKGSHTRRMQ